MFFLYATDRNDWFKSHLCHLAYGSEALLSILIATHLYTANPRSPAPDFEEYYGRSLRLFRGQLDSHDGALDVGVMCAGVFICTLNVSERAYDDRSRQRLADGNNRSCFKESQARPTWSS